MKRVHSVGILLLQYYLSVASYALSRGVAVQIAVDWSSDANDHVQIMEDLLYPPGESMKVRVHQVRQHPIYNFLHTYYRYSTKSIKKYSPGLGVIMEAVPDSALALLNEKYLKITPEGVSYELPKAESPDSTFGWITLSKTRDMLHATASRQPFFGCFGLHEWAMLYSGRIDQSQKSETRHQDLPLRVSQDVIDSAVEVSSALRCTHYDAFRFFHPSAQPMNSVSMLTRDFQQENEQPGCVHAAMDLFKYAYQLYPFLSSDLLRDCLTLAVTARKIDMRASPYDVSGVEGCSEPLCIETVEGRKAYVVEQEALAGLAAPLRLRVIDAYDAALTQLATATA